MADDWERVIWNRILPPEWADLQGRDFAEAVREAIRRCECQLQELTIADGRCRLSYTDPTGTGHRLDTAANLSLVLASIASNPPFPNPGRQRLQRWLDRLAGVFGLRRRTARGS